MTSVMFVFITRLSHIQGLV